MKKDKGVVSSDGYYSEQAGYFDCVDKEISKIENNQANEDSE
jgi:hypothetical protein